MEDSLYGDASPTAGLTAAQIQALQCVTSAASAARSSDLEKAERILARRGMSHTTSVQTIISTIRKNAAVTLNFHPDRILPAGMTVAEGFLAHGAYLSQFETGVSNGSRTAYSGGDRDRWEERLFGGAYQLPGALPSERPKYGAFNVMKYADGASPRFGSCHFRLRSAVSERCTFTFGDSHAGPEHKGTIGSFEPLLAALLEAVENTGEALGMPNLDIPLLIDFLLKPGHGAGNGPSGKLGRALDDYIEAQVHGDIALGRDVEALVADPSFQGTKTGEQLSLLCSKHRIKLCWHAGYRLAADQVPEHFRGPAIPPFARHIADRFAETPGQVDAAVIGKAAASYHANSDDWSSWGTQDEVLQYIKQLWHVLVKFGEPARQG
ncbi:DUF3626 domain-containing protein [Paenibacillus harenae]|uniref:DUF3626 domain-containing protein n=1 Tax=Paenibacillus harenae TaxID=306543 RepID=UPI0003FE2054|nr:DUF3626 domain-containing protein [Paenibacillus harenae]